MVGEYYMVRNKSMVKNIVDDLKEAGRKIMLEGDDTLKKTIFYNFMLFPLYSDINNPTPRPR